ncbi:MAG: type II secretion system secretin GspD [Rhodocyclaceae bacterium]|nr:type II secretion system secretin GspD [Rhodocyclaceae bacterium]
MNRLFHRRGWAGLAAALLLGGCASLASPPESTLEEALRRAARAQDTTASVAARADRLSVADAPAGPGGTTLADGERAAADASGRSAPRIYRGNDTMVKLPGTSARPLRGEAVALRFEQAPIAEVVHAILGDMLEQNYTIHPPVAGEVTLHTLAPLPPDQILTVLESMLQANGLAIAQDATGIYHIGRPEALKAFAPQPRRVGRLPAGNSLLIVPLQYVGASEMAEILAPVAGPAAFVRVDNFRNLLILAGSRGQLQGWMEIVEIFDVDLLKGMSVGLFPLQNTSVDEVEEALRLVTGNERSASPARIATGRPEGAGAAAVATPIGGAMKILPIERLNAILVVTPRAAYLDIAREWIERFDRPDNDGGPRLYVYPVQNGSAAHLATLLNGIFGGGALDTRRSARDSGVAPGLGTSTASALGATASPTTTSATGTTGSGATASSAGQVSQLTFGDVRVVADDQNNALLIYAPRTEYNKIESALRQIDVAPSQVLIEASIVEVSLTDETRYGLQWFFTDNVRGRGWTGSGQLGLGDDGGFVSRSGFSYTITNPLGEVRAVLNALANKQLLKVISSPSVMVLDNQTAEIKVGDQQPVRNARTVTDGGTTTDSISFKDTGVVLKVTPSVNAGNIITMEIDQSVTDVGEELDPATGQRAFLQRQIASKVAVPSGDTVVLGGLIRDNASRGRQGVPLLADLPIVGALFGTTTVNSDRTELLVMITPRVVRTERDVRDVTEEMKRRMFSLRSFLSERTDDAVPGQR